MDKPNASSDPKISGWTKRHDDRNDNHNEGRDNREPSPYADEQALGPAPTAGPMTPSIKTLQPADAPIGDAGENEEDRLDEALQESMTTSDPVSIKIA